MYMKKYLQNHRTSAYLPTEVHLPGLVSYENKHGWRDYYIGDKLLFSHRKTVYDFAFFPEKLHFHDFYEMDIYIDGSISYIADNQEFSPVRDSVIILPPGCQHTARLLNNGTYERYVFYFDPELLDFLGKGYLGEVFRHKDPICLSVAHNKRADFYYLRERLEDVLHCESSDSAAQALCYAVQLLILISNHTKINQSTISEIPQKVLEIKYYVDQNFQTLSTTAEIASQFFYSREYVSRVFKQHYNINLSEYLVNQKINHAKHLLEQGNSVSFCCNAAGFKSTSAFINAFRMRTNMTPSEYKRACRTNEL